MQVALGSLKILQIYVFQKWYILNCMNVAHLTGFCKASVIVLLPDKTHTAIGISGQLFLYTG